MEIRHIGRHISGYWSSLRGAGPAPSGLALGQVLNCPVFVINLERSPNRREYVVRHLATHGIQPRIFAAVDGRALDMAELERRGIYSDSVAQQKFSRSLSAAEVACTLSHLNIYRAILDEAIPMAMIVEDDVLLAPGIAGEIRAALKELPSSWDILQLYTECEERTPVGSRLVRFPCKSRMPLGSAAYLIRIDGAAKMQANGLPVCYPADSLVGRSHRWGVALFGLQQALVSQNTVFPTQIYDHTSLQSRLVQGLKRLLTRLLAGLAKIARDDG